MKYVNEDTLFVLFVIVACLGYMIIHTRSIFLAIASLINIFMSIPIALCIYTYIVKVNYFSSLHLSVIIIIVGIGADDIFVFHDSW